jgi:predicted small metal-binding protein
VYKRVVHERRRTMARKMADCRRFPSESNCSLTIIGEEEEVVRAAAEHAVSVHGHDDTPELREQVKGMLEEESQFQPGTRPQEPMPT